MFLRSNQTKQLDLLAEGLHPSEIDNHAISSKISKDFYFLI
jgi:hypothetical protein